MKITRKPPRYHQDNALYFLTFCTFERHPLLHCSGVPELLIENLGAYAKLLEELIAYTIMPDHMHLLVSVKSVADVSAFLRNFKKWTSVRIHRSIYLPDRHVWQRGTMDHCIRCSWNNVDFKNHLQYLLSNSWKHLQIPPKSFPYHNFLSFVEKGWFDEDFCDYENEEFVKLYE